MSKRLLLIAAVLFSQLACAGAFGATIYVQLFPLTGEVRLCNRDVTPFPFVLYSIKSTNGALITGPSGAGAWKSITGNYDVNGNGFIDSASAWSRISTKTTDLTEGVVGNPGGTLPALRSISLGRIWNPHTAANPVTDLSFDFETSTGPQMYQVDYAIDGDYNGDHKVDLSDYQTSWVPFFGSTFAMASDGNLDGVVDAADYTVWRDHLGNVLPTMPFPAISLPGGGAGVALSASAVPEPTAAILSLLAGGGLSWWRRQRRVARR